MVRTGTSVLEGLVSVGVNLALVDAIKVLLDSGCGTGLVVVENVQRGKLGKVERSVVVGGSLLLESHGSSGCPANVLSDPLLETAVDGAIPAVGVALAKHEDSGSDLGHGLEVANKVSTGFGSAQCSYSQQSSVSANLAIGTTTELSIVEVGVHVGVLVQEPSVDE